ncbi:MAG: hypothetical protein GXP31_06305 [Kiritimatiellaeota bacterium]|nr:hypothetical protein [Kiritimatiellota bacterium]
MPAQSTVAVALFPLLLPIWRERPPTETDLRPLPYPVRLSASDLRNQEKILPHASPALRCRIAVALGRTGRDEAVPMLLAWLAREKTPDVLATLLRQLRRFDMRQHSPIDTVRPLLIHAAPEVRLEAVQLYAALADCNPLELGRAASAEPDRTVRRAVWEALAAHADAMGIEFFRRFWHDSDPTVRAAAVAGSCRKPQVVAYGAELLEMCRDPAVQVRHRLAESIPSCPASLRGPLCRRLARDSHPAVRAAAARAASRLGKPLAPVLHQLCADSDPGVRRLAVAGLAVAPSRTAVRIAAARLADTDGLVRTQAVRTLGVLHTQGLDTGAAAARNLLSPAPAVRAAAYRALGVVGAREYAAALTDALEKDADHSVALAGAIEGLGRLNVTSAASRIAHFVEYGDDWVRIATAAALGRLEVPETYPALARLATDPTPAVRRAAFFAITRTRKAAFAKTCTAVLEQTAAEDPILPADRALACWSAARLRPVDRRLAERLVVQATTPVIPMLGAKMFEPDHVLVSACFALAQMARDEPAVRPLAEKVLAACERRFTPEELRKQPPNTLVPSAYLREYARQARAFLENQKVQPRPRPLEKPSLPVTGISRPRAAAP